MNGKDFAEFHRISAECKEPENPFACVLSENQDGNHSKSWFDGGTCAWCDQT